MKWQFRLLGTMAILGATSIAAQTPTEPKPDLTGRWAFSVVYEGGSGSPTVTLTQTIRPNRPLLFTGGALFLGSYATTAVRPLGLRRGISERARELGYHHRTQACLLRDRPPDHRSLTHPSRC